MAQPITPKSLAQKLAVVWPRSSLVFQPSVGLGKGTYTRIEMQVWVNDKHYIKAGIIPDDVLGQLEHIVSQMTAEVARSIFAES